MDKGRAVGRLYMSEQINTTYRLMILYMLNKVDFPLSNDQISSFILGQGYTNYFTLQKIINSLLEDNLIHATLYNNSTQYTLTKEGADTVSFFSNRLSSPIREDIDKYISQNKYQLRCEVSTTSEYYKSDTGDYLALCRIKEGKNTLVELKLSVPTEDQASCICSKWKTDSQDIYEFIMRKLL